MPVTTGETHDVWLGLTDKPQEAAKKAEDATKLAAVVDFIAAHILPYWDKVAANRAVEHTIGTYNALRKKHEGKRIVIAEFGWPSAGYNHHDATPGRIEQATVLRDFISRADAYGIDYNIIEAFDQPWKTNEGSVGMYWGVFDAAREAKFAWAGPVHDLDHWKFAGLAVLLGLLLSLPIPGTNYPLGIILLVYCIALIERDGALLLIAWAVGIAAIITSAMLSSEVVDLVSRLLN